MVGITAFGAYLPRMRLARKAIVDAHVWADPALRGKAKGERTMCNWDEDAVTMAVEAARHCLDARATTPEVVYFASTSAPFADRQNAGIVTTALSLPEDIASVDVGASQRAGTTALIQALAAASGGMYAEALVVASDKRRTRAASSGEFAFGDGAVAMSVGGDGVIAHLRAAHTASVDFIDHFRGTGQEFDYGWEERWIRDEGLAKIVPPAIGKALTKAGVEPGAVSHLVMPSTIARAVDGIAKATGIPANAVRDNLHANCGETGAAHPLLMLAQVLEQDASAGDVIVVVGFGQGCDVLVLEATEALTDHPKHGGVSAALAARQPESNYQKFLAFNELIALDKGMRAERDDYKTALTVTYRRRDMLLGLVGGRCTQCGTLQFPRADVCVNPQCKAMHTQEPHSFRDAPAKVLTWSADYLTYTPDPPSHYGMISFDDGGRFMTDFTDVNVGEIEVGMPVRMVFRIKSIDHLRGFVRYFWKAVPARTAAAA